MIPFQKPDWTCCYSKLDRPLSGREMSSQVWEGIWVPSPSRSWPRAVVGRQQTPTLGGYDSSAAAAELFLEQEWKLAPGVIPALECSAERCRNLNCDALGGHWNEDPPPCSYYAKKYIPFCLVPSPYVTFYDLLVLVVFNLPLSLFLTL